MNNANNNPDPRAKLRLIDDTAPSDTDRYTLAFYGESLMAVIRENRDNRKFDIQFVGPNQYWGETTTIAHNYSLDSACTWADIKDWILARIK